MILDFLKAAAGLKGVRRQGWIDRLGHGDPETVAEHSYSMAVMGMVFSDLEGMDTGKILRMILLHDLAESEVGDITPGAMPGGEKAGLEDGAMGRILASLPGSLSGQYALLWDEFRRDSSPEARLAHQLDRLEMALQASAYLRDGFAPGKIEPFFDSARDGISDKNIKEIFTEILEDGRGQGRADKGPEPGHRHAPRGGQEADGQQRP